MYSLGDNIKTLRMSKRLSQGEFGKRAGLTEDQIRRYEKSQREINASDLAKLCNAYDVSADVLLNTEIVRNLPENFVYLLSELNSYVERNGEASTKQHINYLCNMTKYAPVTEDAK